MASAPPAPGGGPRRISVSAVRISAPHEARRPVRLMRRKEVRRFGMSGKCKFMGSLGGTRGCFFRVDKLVSGVVRGGVIAFRLRGKSHNVGTIGVGLGG